MPQQLSEPCGLCCGIINHIKCILDEPSERAIGQPPWHKTTQEIRESSESCLLCESIWQATIFPRLKDAMKETPSITLDRLLAVSLKFGSYNKANGVYWANFRTSFEAIDEKIQYCQVNSIGILIQPNGNNFLGVF